MCLYYFGAQPCPVGKDSRIQLLTHLNRLPTVETSFGLDLFETSSTGKKFLQQKRI